MKYSAERVRNATANRQPDFNELKKVLMGGKPSRPTLFEFFLNFKLEEELVGHRIECEDEEMYNIEKIKAFRNAGYDYVTISASNFSFTPDTMKEGKQTKSLNDSSFIHDRKSFEDFEWSDPEAAYTGLPERLGKYLPEGMKFNICGPGGVEENVISLVGYDNLCYMLIDEPQLAEDIFNEVGQRLFTYYQQIIDLDSVGMIISNDDWGFNTQTLLSVGDMEKYVFPWHKKFIGLAHNAGKPIVLHSCGYMGDIIGFFGRDNELAFDGKHSYEDNIKPVEQAYEEYKDRFSIMGGIDLDYLVRRTPDEIYKRAKALIEQTDGCTAFGLGSGNSIPEYVPFENYFAMILAAVEG